MDLNGDIHFICEKKYIDDGTYSIKILELFTLNIDCIVLIEGYGIISDGKFKQLN